MRIAVGGISHETNTYAVASTGLTELERFSVWRAEEIVRHASSMGSALGGILTASERHGDEVVPALFALAEPSGTIGAETYAALKDELVERIAAAMPVDAVGLELHGAGVVEGIDDLEADLGAAIRKVVGPDVAVAAVLDLHGNVSPAMASMYDLLLGCHLYPHTDLWDRGVEAVELLHRMVDDGLRPAMRVAQLPMLLPPATTDGDSAAARTNAMCATVEQRDGVLDCTFMHGFPFTDIPDAGSTMIVVVDTATISEDAASDIAAEAAGWVWDHREDFRHEDDTPETAVRRAKAATAWPVVINEPSDNPGGGTPGDGTFLLRAMLDAGLEDACFAFINDADVVQRAIAAGVGAEIDVHLGAKFDSLHGEPIALHATVKCITDGKFTLRAMIPGWRLHLGPSCRLRSGGVDIVVMSKPFQTIDTEVLLLHGIDASRYKVIGLKSSQHFRAGFRDLAAEIITADSPGLTTNRVDVFVHERLARPSWPIESAASFAGRPPSPR